MTSSRYAANPNPKPLDEVIATLDKGGKRSNNGPPASLDTSDAALMMSVRRNASIADEDLVRMRLVRHVPPASQLLPLHARASASLTAFSMPPNCAKLATSPPNTPAASAISPPAKTSNSTGLPSNRSPSSWAAWKKWGLITRAFACGDTPRNVVGCPMAGYLADEIIDARAAALTVNDTFVAAGKELSNLPRKFKTAIAGCHLPLPPAPD